MNSSELARRIDELQPDATPLEIARLVLLIQNAVDDIDELEDEERLLTVWREINWRLEAATDQHAAMTDELENLAKSDPQEFSPDQIWILIRAIKVQSQILRLSVGDQCCEVGTRAMPAGRTTACALPFVTRILYYVFGLTILLLLLLLFPC